MGGRPASSIVNNYFPFRLAGLADFTGWLTLALALALAAGLAGLAGFDALAGLAGLAAFAVFAGLAA